MNLQEPFHYSLPLGDHLFHEGLYLTNAGWEQIRPGQPYPNQDHPLFYLFDWENGRVIPNFCIAWLMAGEGEFQTKTQHLRLKKGQVFMILPGEWHRHRPALGVGWALAWIEFNGALPYQWWKGGAFGSSPNLPAVRNVNLFALQFQDLLLQVHANPASNTPILSATATGIISHMLEDLQKRHSDGGSGDAVVDKAVETIWNFSHGMTDVAEIARRTGVGRRALERRFKETKGHGILKEIQSCRLGRAMRLLAETNLPIKVIVVRAGFGSYEQFRKAFFKLNGMSPQDYRDGKP